MHLPSSLQKASEWLRHQPTLGRWALKCVPDVRVKILIEPIGGFNIRLRRNRSFWLRHPLTHELFPLGALQRLVKPDSVVYDVGANIGLYARFMLQQFGARCVVCFEPMTENRAMLEDNIRAGDCARQVQIMPWALCDKEGEEDLQVDDMMSGSATLDRVTGGNAANGRKQYGMEALTEKVSVARLDQLVASHHLPPPNVIKVDIEGAEGLMLEGARETLRQHQPDLLIELHGASVAGSVFSTLTSLGYSCFGELNVDGRHQYTRVTQRMIDGLTDYYDLHFIVASTNPAKLEQPIEAYRSLSSPAFQP